MLYNKFGNTGTKISALGFGCMRLPEYQRDGKWFIKEELAVPLLQKAYQSGVNYFDTAFYYCNENSEIVVGKALQGVRDKVHIATKIPLDHHVESTKDYRKMLELQLTKMGLDYIDFYHFWGINLDCYENKIEKLGLLKEALKAKDEGLIKHISFSFHDDPKNMKVIIDRAEILESVLCQYNLLDRSNEEAIKYAASKGLGVVAMGPVAGGRLVAPTNLSEKVAGGKQLANYELAFKFVLGNPNIDCALSGMENLDMLEKNLQAAGNSEPITELEQKRIAASMTELKKFSDLYCTGCNYCQPCPANINIPAIFNSFTLHNVYGLSGAAKKAYSEYNANNPTVDACTGCGVCKEKCPQKIDIPAQLKRVDKVLKDLYSQL